jgi:RNA polymerase sigma-70 factor, ECF subfamily
MPTLVVGMWETRGNATCPRQAWAWHPANLLFPQQKLFPLRTWEKTTVDHDRQPGDQRRADEFLELYASCEHRLYVYIVTLIGNPIDAHDILQDTALVLWRKYDQFDRVRPFFAWAREFARYRTLRYRQIHANDAPALEPEALNAVAARLNSTDDARDRLYAEALPGCIDRLNENDRELVRLRYSTGTAVKAIAESLNRSVNGVSQSLARVRQLLRKCVEETVRQQQNQEGSLE